jgi:succinate dehydrogenase / fumarate reductase cytochrome b subunit
MATKTTPRDQPTGLRRWMPTRPSVGGDAVSPAPKTTAPAGYRAGRIRALWRTTIGKKYVVAITGVIMAIWLILHMLGNLKAFGGPGPAGGQSAVDHYSHWLRTAFGPVIPPNVLLWIVRGVVLGALVLHIVAITQLWARNRNARPAGYRSPKRVRSTISARTMYFTGPAILAFLVFHILHFTTRTIHPNRMVGEHVYYNLDTAFSKWWLVVIYVGAVALLGMHLWHSLWSSAQTMGMDNPDRNWFWRRQAAVLSVVVAVGFAAVPVLFLVGALPDAKSPTAHAEVHQR